MGVLRFFKHLLNTYKHFYTLMEKNPSKGFQVDVLLIDLNAIFHPAVKAIYYPANVSLLHPPPQKSDEELEVLAFANVVKFIEAILHVCPPRQVLYLAIDGVAGMCKQSQQRKRRYKAAQEIREGSDVGVFSASKEKFNSAHLTAGTPFMGRLCAYIQQWIIQRKQIEGGKGVVSLKNVQVIYSDMFVAGEGEHKLIKWVSKNVKNNKLSYCVYSPDADLIMLCLCLPRGKGYILRENIYDNIRGAWILVNCNQLREQIQADVKWEKYTLCTQNNQGNEENQGVDSFKLIRDYVLFLMLVGNDFLPSLYCLEIGNEGIETLQRCYISAATNHGFLLNAVNLIDKKSFTALFEALSIEEPDLILAKYHTKMRHPDTLLSAHVGFQNVQSGHQNNESGESSKTVTVYNLHFEALRKQYYIKKFQDFDWDTENEVAEANIKTICSAYIRGLNFVMTYYTKSIPSFEWCYEYHYAPLMIDIWKFANECSQADWDRLQVWNFKPALTLNQALIGIIPPSSASVLPASLQPLLTNNKDHPLFTETFEVDYEGKQQDYEGVCLLPNVSYKTLKKMCVDESVNNFEAQIF